MATLPTNFITSTGQDLNEIFAPIVVNQIDYGNLTITDPIEEVWTKFDDITQIQIKNVEITPSGTKGFIINSNGLYKLNVTLNFGDCKEETQNIVFILSSSSNRPDDDGYTFTPSPTMSNIYSINCSGGSAPIDDSLGNNLNVRDIGNCFALIENGNTNINSAPYFYKFQTRKNNDGTSVTRTNFFTLDMTFVATEGQTIYPYIRCMSSSSNVNALLQRSKWMFTKINSI